MVNLIIDGITTTLYGVQTYDIVQIINGGTLDVQTYDGTIGTGTIEIHANSILIDATSSILGDARGFRGALGQDFVGLIRDSEGPGRGSGTTPGSGAGYGGNGGGTNLQPGIAYGTLSGTDIERGSGGGCGNTGTRWGVGGSGGALIALYAISIEIAGTISSNGGNGISAYPAYPVYEGSGGGSGGGILLSGGTIIVSGTLSANGGLGSDALDWYHTGGDGGAGGRIKLFPSSTITFTGIETVIGGPGGASVGPGPGLPGESGTIYHADIPTTGDVNFHVTCEGTPCTDAYITIGINTYGPTDITGIVTVTGIPPGPTSYTVSKTGYYDGSESVNVITGSTVDASIVNLILIPGSLAINITPSDAVYNVIDSLGNTVASNVLSGTTVSNLTPGTYSSTLTRTGYQDKLLSNIVIGPGESVTLTDILIPLPVSAGSSGFALLSLGLLFGLILGKKKCEDKHTKEECEKTGCQWKDGKCIERK